MKLEYLWLPLMFALGGATMATLFIALGIANSHKAVVPVLLGLTAAGLVFGLICATHHRFMKTGELSTDTETF